MVDMSELYSGESVTSAEELEAYRGMAAMDRIVGPERKIAYLYNHEQLRVNYGENVEYQLRKAQVILCPQTMEYLYSEFTPLETRYVKGTRPELERMVAELSEGCVSDREQALAFMRFCRDLYKRAPRSFDEYVYGGTEEQLIEKGEGLCECLGRLMVALCEVAGIPGRLMMHDIGGHITSEVYVEGGWAYIDPRCGVYCLNADGRMLSAWEIWNDLGVLRRQNDEVKAEVSELWSWEFRAETCEKKYFHPLEVNGFQSYSLMDAGRYTYAQLSTEKVTARGLYVLNADYRAMSARVFGLEDS